MKCNPAGLLVLIALTLLWFRCRQRRRKRQEIHFEPYSRTTTIMSANSTAPSFGSILPPMSSYGPGSYYLQNQQSAFAHSAATVPLEVSTAQTTHAQSGTNQTSHGSQTTQIVNPKSKTSTITQSSNSQNTTLLPPPTIW